MAQTGTGGNTGVKAGGATGGTGGGGGGANGNPAAVDAAVVDGPVGKGEPPDTAAEAPVEACNTACDKSCPYGYVVRNDGCQVCECEHFAKSCASANCALPSNPGGASLRPTEIWSEHWKEHREVLQLVDFNEWAVAYADKDVDRSKTDWMLPFLTKVWQYTVQHYGAFTDGHRDGRLYHVFHQGRYGGGHPATYFAASHDFRNVSDCGSGPWADVSSTPTPVHEIAHVVEFSSRGVFGSPAFGVWGDSKWAEFYVFDVYKGLGMEVMARKTFASVIGQTDTFPRKDTRWFANWYYPLWRDFGQVKVMANFFVLLAQNFPKDGTAFTREMNLGEYIHFMSGAVDADLKWLATNAFGWTAETEQQWQAARAAFPKVVYKSAGPTKLGCVGVGIFPENGYGGNGVGLEPGNYTRATLETYGFKDESVSSIRIGPGCTATLFENDQFGGKSLEVKADLKALTELQFNDTMSSIRVR